MYCRILGLNNCFGWAYKREGEESLHPKNPGGLISGTETKNFEMNLLDTKIHKAQLKVINVKRGNDMYGAF